MRCMAVAAARFFAPLLEVMNLPAWDCLPYDRVSPQPGDGGGAMCGAGAAGEPAMWARRPCWW